MEFHENFAEFCIIIIHIDGYLKVCNWSNENVKIGLCSLITCNQKTSCHLTSSQYKVFHFMQPCYGLRYLGREKRL
jgi:hypothetical protein